MHKPSGQSSNRCAVLWSLPSGPPPQAAVVLSFLDPREESRLRGDGGVRVVSGRELGEKVKGAAVALYHKIVVQMGIARTAKDLTFRQTLRFGSRESVWWYHMVAFRDSERSEYFGWIVQVLTVRLFLEREGVTEVQLTGGPAEVIAVLRNSVCPAGRSVPGLVRWPGRYWLYGVAARVRYLYTFLRDRLALSRHYRLPSDRFDVAFCGFWDQSFQIDPAKSAVIDRYFKKLPHLLRAEHDQKVGYFAWFAPYLEPAQRHRPRSTALRPLSGRGDVVLIQALLELGEVCRALIDFRPLRLTQRALHSPEFRCAMQYDGIDWEPVFADGLLRGSANAHIPHCQLVELATERATRRYRPMLTLSFLEHFPYARAHYRGVQATQLGTENWAIQHAGCCSEKTFYYLDPEVEFNGAPDGCSVPHPDRVYAMGRLGERIFRQCGYAESAVKLTGSTRYDHIRFDVGNLGPRGGTLRQPALVRVLLACSLEVNYEIAMVEAAVLAAKTNPHLKLRLRNHPMSRVDEHSRFEACRGSVEISVDPLDVDLAWADLILFSYSTVADEAFLSGKPVWQWIPLGFNGSALTEATEVPRFSAVAQLASALAVFQASPEKFYPKNAAIVQAAEALFYPANGRAAESIAADCRAFLFQSGRDFASAAGGIEKR